MNVRLLFLATSMALAPAAYGQAENSPLAPLFECRAIPDDAERLACLDRVVDALQGETESGEIVAVDRGQIEAAEEATYGLSIPGFSLPDVPRLSLPDLRGNSEDLAEADTESAGSGRNVVRTDEGRIDRIENLAIAELRETAHDKLIIELQNGQVWTQIDNTRISRPRGVADNEMTATIRSASMGSFMVRLNDNGRWFRARRTQ